MTAGLALLASAATATATVLVVRSTGPAARIFPVGRQLPDNVRLRLGRRDSVTILHNRGTRVFRGPGNFSPLEPVRAGRRGERRIAPRSRLGGIRMSSLEGGRYYGPDSSWDYYGEYEWDNPSGLPSIWDVDVTRSGTICLRQAARVRLTRSDLQPAGIEILASDTAPRTLDWARGSRFLAWPADLPITDGAAFEVRPQESREPTRIVFRLIPHGVLKLTAEEEPQVLAETFIAEGCQAQLDRLVDALLPAEAD